MKKLIVLSIIAVTMFATSTAHAALQVQHRPWKQLTKAQKVSVLRKQIRHDHSIVRFWHNHYDLNPILARSQTHWANISIKVASGNLQKMMYKPTGFSTPAGFPPHHALWMCEYRDEAASAPGGWFNQDTGHNGHYGGLQMYYNWGYGIVGYAYNYSQLEQEWAAERGYRAHGYSHTWLIGQWAHYDCLAYA